MMADVLTVIATIVGAVVLAVLLYVILLVARDFISRRDRLRQKYGYVPRHVELYFEEYFPTIVREWDLVTKPRLSQWRDGIKQKMTVIDADISHIQTYRNTLDTRLDRLEKDVTSIEQQAKTT